MLRKDSTSKLRGHVAITAIAIGEALRIVVLLKHVQGFTGSQRAYVPGKVSKVLCAEPSKTLKVKLEVKKDPDADQD